MKQTVNLMPKHTVLVFNAYRKLIAIYNSITSAARVLGVTPTTVSMACKGESITCSNLYFRIADDNIEIELSDLGSLRIEDYDKMCGQKRAYLPTKKIMLRAALSKNRNQTQEAV